jgi:hypothetical protein
MASKERPMMDPSVERVLEPDEELQLRARARDAEIVITDQRLLVAANDRLALAVPFERLRRIQFDIERSRPATMVIVPEQPQDEPQVLAVDPDAYDEITQALAVIGRRLASVS